MATSPNYGWEEPDDTDLVKDGALSIRTMGNAIDSTLGTALNNKLHAGLVLVKTQTVGTGVSSVTVTGAFSSTYDAYKVFITGSVASGNDYLYLQLGASGTGYYDKIILGAFGNATVSGAGNSNGGAFYYAGGCSANGVNFDVELTNPYLAKYSQVVGTMAYQYASGMGIYGGEHRVATSYTSFTIASNAGATLTGGTIAVYGYAKD